MAKLPVSVRGRVQLSRDLLEHLGIRTGDSIVVTKLPHERVELRAVRSEGKITDAFGLLKRGRRQLTVKAINRIAAGAWAGKR